MSQPNYRLHNSYWLAFRAVERVYQDLWNKKENRWKTAEEIHLPAIQYAIGHAVNDMPTPESFYGEPQSTPTDPLHGEQGRTEEG